MKTMLNLRGSKGGGSMNLTETTSRRWWRIFKAEVSRLVATGLRDEKEIDRLALRVADDDYERAVAA